MPQYFVLSGLFFKSYACFKEYIIQKTNGLLIPFLFFWLIALLFYIFKQIVGGGVPDLQLLAGPYYEEINNFPIWFLLCLFICSILFYCIKALAEKCSRQKLVTIFAVLLIGIVGFDLGKHKVNLPFWIDSAMTALPFYAFGYVLRKYTPFIEKDDSKLKCIGLSILFFLITFVLRSPSDIKPNYMADTNIWQFYLCAITGTIAVLFFAKCIKRIPIVSYFGRYSICILVTHIFLVYSAKALIQICGINITSRYICALICIPLLLLYLIIIPLMRKFLPHVCAQKSLIKYKPANAESCKTRL